MSSQLRIVETRPDALVVDPGPFRYCEGTTCMLFAGEVGTRHSGRSRTIASQPGRLELAWPGTWQPVDAREHRRFETRLRAGVRSPDAGDEHFGVTIDVSAGGMAVEVLEDPGDDYIEVSAGLREDPSFLPCDVINRRAANGVTVLHLRFRPLDAGQATHRDQLIEDIQRAVAS